MFGDVEKEVDGVVIVRRFLCAVLGTCLAIFGNCSPLESITSDVAGWDVSACVSGFDVCWDLFWDNSDKFEEGFTDAMDTLFP